VNPDGVGVGDEICVLSVGIPDAPEPNCNVSIGPDGDPVPDLGPTIDEINEALGDLGGDVGQTLENLGQDIAELEQTVNEAIADADQTVDNTTAQIRDEIDATCDRVPPQSNPDTGEQYEFCDDPQGWLNSLCTRQPGLCGDPIALVEFLLPVLCRFLENQGIQCSA
jgi:hypothetical protein